MGLDRKGNMDVPESTTSVGWYSLGYKAGEAGNTVLDGHFDTKSGDPAVFYHLEGLQNGDTIVLYGDWGERFTYKVAAIKNYPYNALPLQVIK